MTNPIFVDASTITSMAQAVLLNKSSISTSSNVTRADRFWSSQTATITSAQQEVLEIDFASASLTNRLAFDAVKFPQTIVAEYTQDNGTNWLPMLDATTGQPIIVTVLQSFPPILPNPSALSDNRHPQHDYSGHWERHSFQIAPDTVQKIRFRITRNSAGTGPVNADGLPVPYSVALQNTELGYEVRSKKDVPRALLEPTATSTQITQTFANTSDLFNSNVGFAQRTRTAASLMSNTDTSAPAIWKSEPQPFPSAVVNFYADLRDNMGNSQIVDRIFLDPLYEGPYLNLYYSNQTSVASFASGRHSLTSAEASLFNGAVVDTTAKRLNLGTFTDPCQLNVRVTASMFASGDTTPLPALTPVNNIFLPVYAQINNTLLNFDPSQDWWMGMSFLPTGNPWRTNFDNLLHPLFSCSQFEIGYYTRLDGSTVNVYAYFKTQFGDFSTALIYTDGVSNNISEIQIVAGYVGGSLHLTTQHHGQSTTYDVPASVAFTTVIPPVIFLGTDTLIDRFSNPSIDAFILKQETLPDDGFITNPTAYSYVSQFPSQVELGSKNALLRFDPTLVDLSAPTGLVGGPAFAFDNLTWTPIARSYAMHRGSMIIPATKASFWKLEMTNLRPEINEKFVTVTREVKTFPAEMVKIHKKSKTGNDRKAYSDLASLIQSELAYALAYQDIPRYTGTGNDSQSFSNTEVYVAQDENTAKRLGHLGSEWKYRQWHPDTTVPRFTQVQVHEYTVQEVQQTSSVSYYAGLRNIEFQRTTPTVPADLAVIEENFLDNGGVDPTTSNWLLDPNLSSLNSGSSTYARVTSVIIPTQRNLRGLQFAAQQSDSKLVNIYGEFSNGTYDQSGVSTWTGYGDGKVLGIVPINNSSGQALLVSRQIEEGFWADIPVNFTADPIFTVFGADTYGAITRYDPSQYPSQVAVPGISTSYGSLTGGSGVAAFSGGLTSTAVNVPNGGRLYAAARVTATSALSAPLYVQIIDADTGNLLAEQQQSVAQSQVQEWYAGIDVNAFPVPPILGQRWKDIAGKRTYPSFNDTFTRSNATTLGNMTPSGQAWSTPGTSLQIVSNAAQCTLTGQRSEFDALTPWGTLQVTLPNIITAGGPFQLIDLGGIILRSDGKLFSTLTSGQIGSTITLTAGHNYSFRMVLTSVATGVTLDATVFPYSIEVRDNGSLVQTISTAHSFGTVRALLGGTGQNFDDMIWTPGIGEINILNQMATLPIPVAGQMFQTNYGDGSSSWAQSIAGAKASDPVRYRNWFFAGSYTYGTNIYANNASSLSPGGTFLGAPTGLNVTVQNPPNTPGSSSFVATTGNPTFAAQATLFVGPTVTYFWKVTATNAAGETIGSNEVTAAVQNGGSAILSWTAVAGATNYKVYRSTTTNTELFVASAGNYTTFTDPLASNVGNAAIPTVDTSSIPGSIAIAQMMDNYGTMEFNVTQMPSGLATSVVPVAYLNYNLSTGHTLTLFGDGTIKDQNGSTLATIGAFNALSGPISVRYVQAQILSSAMKTTWGIVGTDTQAIVVVQGTTVKTVIHGTALWDSTWRGVGGANDGTVGAGHYSIIEGPGWYPEGDTLIPDMSAVTWLVETDNNTATYGALTNFTPPGTTHIQVRLVQKTRTNDFWYVQALALFWDPIIWEFSADAGVTWWRALDVRNDPNACVQFPYNLTNYTSLRWRLTSFSPDMHVTHLAIRPWYQGSEAYGVEPRPTQLPLGPNLVPSDYYTRIEDDPRWKTWNIPIPRWWWNAYQPTT